MTNNFKADCQTCANSQQQIHILMCLKFNVVASPRVAQDCTDYEPKDGGIDLEQGRGD